MALAPARTKFRKSQKGSLAGNAKRGNTLAFGEFGLQSLTRGPMTGRQIEAARVTISRHLKRKGKLWIRVFPHKPVTKKPAEVRKASLASPPPSPRRPFASPTPSCPSSAASSCANPPPPNPSRRTLS